MARPRLNLFPDCSKSHSNMNAHYGDGHLPGPGNLKFGGHSSSSNRLSWTNDILELQLEDLILQKEEDLKTLHPLRGKSIDHSTIQLTFYLCEKLSLSNVIKFHAIEIYDRWLISHHEELNSHINKSGLQQNDVTLLEDRLRKTSVLRLCTCIQLASKFATRNNYVKNGVIKKLLERMGYTFNKKQIASSETRVFRALDFKLSNTATLDTFELLQKIVHVSDRSESQSFRQFAVKILEFMYLFKDTIYIAFQEQLVKHNPSGSLITPNQLHGLENDSILRAAAVVYCAVMLIKPVDFCDGVLSDLKRRTRLIGENIRILALCIASEFLKP